MIVYPIVVTRDSPVGTKYRRVRERKREREKEKGKEMEGKRREGTRGANSRDKTSRVASRDAPVPLPETRCPFAATPAT